MKIQTNSGEVTLTAAMVCKGMVFQCHHLRATALAPLASGEWETTDGSFWPLNWYAVLGCDPAIASRADCERYGVHGDAAAHGFARLRDGGAVDLRRVPIRGAVALDTEHSARFEAHDCTLRVTDRFLGLNADHASPEDVRRLCCLAPQNGDIGSAVRCTLTIGEHEQHEDIATGTKWAAEKDENFNANLRASAALADPRRCLDCLAGEGQMCADDCPRVARYKATRCGARPERGQVLDRGNYDLGFHIATGEEACTRGKDCDGCHVAAVDFQNLAWSGPPVFLLCPICTAKVMPYAAGLASGFSVYDQRAGKNRESAVCETCFKAHADNVAALRWEGDRLVVPDRCPCDALGRGTPGLHTKDCKAGRAIEWEMGTASLGQSQAHVLRDGDVYRWMVTHLGRRVRDGVEPHASPAMQRAGNLLHDVHEATAGIEWLAAFFGLLFRIHDAAPSVKRASQERALVALVDACPDGLDPIGWRAAVLALREVHQANGHDAVQTVKAAENLTPMLREFAAKPRAALCGNSLVQAMRDAYHRTITPAPNVDRPRLTWKTRGPVLAVDDGRDDD